MHTSIKGESRTLHLTEPAFRRLTTLLIKDDAANSPSQKLRVSIDGGGCSGFQYRFSFDAVENPDDIIFSHQGIHVIIDDVSLGLIAGSHIDFVEDLMSAAFVIKNPNATASCGCGNSFSIF